MTYLLRYRVYSSLVGIPLILLSAWFGGWLLLVFTAVLITVSIFEISGMLKRMELKPPLNIMLAGSLILLGSVFLYGSEGIAGALTLVLALLMLFVVLRYPAGSPVDGAAGLLGILYTGMFVYIYVLRLLPHGFILLLFMLLGTWASDTSAYFIGKKFGKRKLAPALSPGKTVEGAVGGLAGSILVAAVFSRMFSYLPAAHLLILGVLLAVAALLGDLWESALKRTAGVKDTGSLIPGHGGVLDRFDSMLFTAPLVYYYVAMLVIK